MPQYEYTCEKCGAKISQLSSFEERPQQIVAFCCVCKEVCTFIYSISSPSAIIMATSTGD